MNNGLRVVHSEDRSTQMVCMNIVYNVGARNEHPEHTGFAHLFEHLMFGGSVNIPDYDTPMQEAGGENNAWTNNDITNYFLSIPRQNVEVGFWLESDRMLSLAFTPKSLEVQRNVVIEEFKQRCLNQPYGDAGHLVRSLVYKNHPYQWPTIGKTPQHIQDANMDLVKDFFFSFYAPNNAILAVTGNISFKETVKLAEKWFGPIPSRVISQCDIPVEPVQNEYRKMEVERPVPMDSLYMSFPMCARLEKDFYAFDALSDVLANGKSCRLIQQLVREKALFSSINAYITNNDDPGIFQIVGKPVQGVSLQEAEDAVMQVLQELGQKPVDEQEFEKVKNKFESEQIFSNISALSLASNLAYFEHIHQAEDINLEADKYRAISAQHLQDVAAKTFVKEKCNVVHYRAGSGMND